MVRVTGQLDAPLVDISSVREGYWQSKEIKLPSLAKYHKTSGWFSWFRKSQVPKIVLTRISKTDFEKIDAEFMELKMSILQDGPELQRLTAKVMEGKEITKIQMRFVMDTSLKLRPYLHAMLSQMIIEPKMSYEEVTDMMDALDDFDANSLYAIVNAITSEKARALKYLHDKRTAEMNDYRQSVMVGG